MDELHGLAALADPTRRRIVELLARREQTAGQIVDEFDLTAPAISQHLKILREAGLVRVRAEGQFRIHAIDPAGFRTIDAWLAKTRRQWERRLDALERAMEEENEAFRKKGTK
jgi:DNA-binding transcriptional ArsR family regulator